MDATILELARQYGWAAVLIFLVIANAKSILGWSERMLAKLWPQISAARETRLQRVERERQGELAQACRLYDELVRQIRAELQEERTERRSSQGRVYQLIQRYEREMSQLVEQHERQMAHVIERYEGHVATSIEVLHDLSDQMRRHEERLAGIEQCLNVRIVSGKHPHNEDPALRAGGDLE